MDVAPEATDAYEHRGSVLGAAARAAGLIVATGHRMLGVTLAPASGEAVAEMIVTGTVPADMAPFRVGRRL